MINIYLYYIWLRDLPWKCCRFILITNWPPRLGKNTYFPPLNPDPKQAKLWLRFGPPVRAPGTRSFQHWPTLFVALRVSDATRFAIFTAMWFAQRRWWLTGGDIETFPRLTRRGFFCLRFVAGIFAEFCLSIHLRDYGYYSECRVNMRGVFRYSLLTIPHGYNIEP